MKSSRKSERSSISETTIVKTAATIRAASDSSMSNPGQRAGACGLAETLCRN